MLTRGGDKPLNPSALRKPVLSELPHFGDGEKYDVLEFLAQFWERLGAEADKGQSRRMTQDDKGISVVADTVAFVESSTLTCPVCKTSTVTSREATHLVVALPLVSNVSLEECLAERFAVKVLDQDNGWNCPDCQAPVCAEKWLRLKTLPEVMVLSSPSRRLG